MFFPHAQPPDPHLSELCQGPAWPTGCPSRKAEWSGRQGPQDGTAVLTSAGAAAFWDGETGQVRGLGRLGVSR